MVSLRKNLPPGSLASRKNPPSDMHFTTTPPFSPPLPTLSSSSFSLFIRSARLSQSRRAARPPAEQPERRTWEAERMAWWARRSEACPPTSGGHEGTGRREDVGGRAHAVVDQEVRENGAEDTETTHVDLRLALLQEYREQMGIRGTQMAARHTLLPHPISQAVAQEEGGQATSRAAGEEDVGG
ncbi:unnamed protein product [Closterium sp. Naga37s-1]|nr:unnamed protein product [Closterium sp. Naga37s-1]